MLIATLAMPSDRVLLWLPLAAAVLHIFEEFVWPGGFAHWYRRYDPGAASSITTPFLVTMNAILVALCFAPPLLGATPRGIGYWLTASAVCAGNGVWHCYATWKTRAYSPGTVTGTLIYLPLAAYGAGAFVASGRATTDMVTRAAVIGAGYVLWSSFRRRRQRLVA